MMSLAIKPTDLLIAPPNIQDPRFQETVLMVISHNDTGTVALCLNGAADISTEDLAELGQLDNTMAMDHPIHWGGPVARESIWMLHTTEWTSSNTLEISDDVAVSSDLEMLEAVRQGETPYCFRIVNGFASWAPGQLEAELEGYGPHDKRHAWLVAPSGDLETLLDCPIEDLWTLATSLCAQSAVDSWLN
jgi:putative transcriptional regulator